MFNKSWVDGFIAWANKAKLLLGSLAFLVTTVVGGYTLAGEFFITKVKAEELMTEVKQELQELKKQTKANNSIITEMRMIRLEGKLFRGEKLTPTEIRVYENLKKKYSMDNVFMQ